MTVGFGVRNLADLDRGLREMARVLKPGGRLVILEITQPDAPAALDLLLALVRPHRAAARHALRRARGLQLPARVGPQLPLAARPRGEDGPRPGFEEIRYTVLAGGIIAIHSGAKRAPRG